MVELARCAEVPVAYALPWANGVMERIWHFAAQYAPAGDIGRVPDEAIARCCAWPESESEKLIESLLQSRWLEPHPVHRLVIHDWRHHCEDAVHSKLARGHQYFWDGYAPKVTGLRHVETESAKKFYENCPFLSETTPARPLATPLQPLATPVQPRCNPLASASASAVAHASATDRKPKHAQIGEMQLSREKPDSATDVAGGGDPASANHTPSRAVQPINGQRKTDPVKDWYDGEFYPVFPLHKARENGLKAARAHLKTPELRARALNALTRQLPELHAREPSKRPYPATWINGRRWEDEPEPPFKPQQPRQKDFASDVEDVLGERFRRGELH